MAPRLGGHWAGLLVGMTPKNRACKAKIRATFEMSDSSMTTKLNLWSKNTMEITNQRLSESADEPSPLRVTLKPSHRPNVLASVSVQLDTDLGTITIHDGRILRNRAGVAWFSLPTYSVTKGRECEYFATAELSPALQRQVSDAALAGFVEWEKAQAQLGGAK